MSDETTCPKCGAEERFKVGDFTHDYALLAENECYRQAEMSDEAEKALWDHMGTTISLLRGELRSVHKCWNEDVAALRVERDTAQAAWQVQKDAADRLSAAATEALGLHAAAEGDLEQVTAQLRRVVERAESAEAALADAADALCECGMSEHYAPLMARIDALLAAVQVGEQR